MRLSLHEIGQAVAAKNDVTVYPDSLLGNPEFDSRKIKQGDLFIPLKGARDGHDFIDQAFEQGALATLSEKPLSVPHILVDDVLTAFQTLARYYLEKMAVEVIAVTGSNGKTTTKDMIAQVLATTYKTYKTQGNYNNEIGLPYTVLHMPEDTEKLVLEMGQDHLGDIHLLSQIARPSLALITLIGEAHLEFFGSREKIAEGKMQIADGMPEGGELLIPADPLLDAYLPQGQRVVRFGDQADIFLTKLEEAKTSLTFETNFLEGSFHLPLPGSYNATNAMLAAYVGKACGVGTSQIQQALAEVQLTANRTQWKKARQGADILSDVYNANPTAMRLILETFARLPKNPDGKKLVVLADMKELGSASAQLHAGIQTSLTADLDAIYLYGPEMKALADALADDDRLRYYEDADQFTQLKLDIETELQAQDQILFKGSNSMKLGEIVEALVGDDD